MLAALALGLGKMDFERLVGREDCNMSEVQNTVLLRWNKEVRGGCLLDSRGSSSVPGTYFCRLKGGC